jgi:two-component system LytT family response regulator
MIKSVIIEDEIKNAHLLKTILGQYCPDVEVLANYRSIADICEFFPRDKPELMFMDIMLSDGNSMEALSQIQLNGTQIIFTTAYDQYAIKAIRFSALDYLLKPIDIDELKQAVDRAKNKLLESKRNDVNQLINIFSLNREKITKLALPSMEGHTFVDITDIIRIQSDGAYSTFHLKSKEKIMVSRQIKEYEMLLENEGFFRLHQSHVINLACIAKFVKRAGGYVIMSDGSEIEVASRRKTDFMKRLNIS